MEYEGRNLRSNMKGDDVKELQQALHKLGFAIAGEKGRFGKNTAKVVRAFQEKSGLETTGKAEY
jgi:lysozyme